MKEIIKMLVVLSVICTVCGFGLALVKDITQEQIEKNVLKGDIMPAVEKVLKGSTNDLLNDRKEITVNNEKILVFIGKKDGKTWSIAYEKSGQGYGGPIGVMVGFNIETDKLTGIGVTTLNETKGIGTRVKEEDVFANKFIDKSVSDNLNLKANGGIIDVLTGATRSSTGVSVAVATAVKIYKDVKSSIQK